MARSEKNYGFILLERWKRKKFYYQWKHWTPKGLIEILCSTNVFCFHLWLLTLSPLEVIISKILSKKWDFSNCQVFGNIFAKEIHFTCKSICSFNKQFVNVEIVKFYRFHWSTRAKKKNYKQITSMIVRIHEYELFHRKPSFCLCNLLIELPIVFYNSPKGALNPIITIASTQQNT